VSCTQCDAAQGQTSKHRLSLHACRRERVGSEWCCSRARWNTTTRDPALAQRKQVRQHPLRTSIPVPEAESCDVTETVTDGVLEVAETFHRGSSQNAVMVTYGAIPEAERSSRARAAPMLALMGLAVVAVVAIVTLSTQSRAVEMVSFPQDDLGILKEMVSCTRGCVWGAATGAHAGRAGHVCPQSSWSAPRLSVARRGGDVLEQIGAWRMCPTVTTLPL
jgi:hypothetical protein